MLACVLLVFSLLYDSLLSHMNFATHLLVFAGVIEWMPKAGIQSKYDSLSIGIETERKTDVLTFIQAIIWLLAGLIILIISPSRLIAWQAVAIAHELGISDLIIGWTIIAICTCNLATAKLMTLKATDYS